MNNIPMVTGHMYWAQEFGVTYKECEYIHKEILPKIYDHFVHIPVLNVFRITRCIRK